MDGAWRGTDAPAARSPRRDIGERDPRAKTPMSNDELNRRLEEMLPAIEPFDSDQTIPTIKPTPPR